MSQIDIKDSRPDTDPAQTKVSEETSGRVRWIVGLTTFAIFFTLLVSTVVLPLLRIPDEQHHADMVLMAKEGDWIDTGWPGLGERDIEPSILAASRLLIDDSRANRDVVEAGERAPLSELGTGGNTDAENRAAQHPPLYYLGSAGASYAVSPLLGELDFVEELWSYRVAGVLAITALPLIFYLVARELTVNPWVRGAAAIFPLAVPGVVLRVGPMINNDTVLVLCTSLSILMALRIAKGDLRLRTAALTGAAAGLGMLSKGFGMIAVLVIALGYLVLAVRRKGVSRDWFTSVATSSGVAILLGGWWWLRNLVFEGSVLTFRQVERSPDFVPDWLNWATTGIRELVGSFWGGSFALPAHSYMWLFWSLTAIFFVGCVLALVRSGEDRGNMLVALAFGLVLLVAVPLASAKLYIDRGMVKGVQGRYFYPALAGVAPVALIGLAGLRERLSRWLPAVVAVGAVFMNWLAINFMLRQYWSRLGKTLAERWDGVLLWSPLPSWLTTGLLLAAVLGNLAVLTYSVWACLRDSGTIDHVSTERTG